MIEWGQRGVLSCAKILNQLKESPANEDSALPDVDKPISRTVGDSTSSAESVEPDPAEIPDDEPPAKKRPRVEDYQAILEAENGEGGFLDAGDIPQQ